MPPGNQHDGSTARGFVESVDVFPTLRGPAGRPKPSGLDGASFAAALRDPATRTKDSIIHVHPRNLMLGRAIRTARRRLVEWKKPGDPSAEPARPAQNRAAMFARRDKDGDGKLTRGEFLANQPDPDEATKRLLRFDANGDGVPSREEFVGMGKVATRTP